MTIEPLPFDAARVPARVRWALLALWGACAAFLVAHHAPWRDEVRALTLALNGADTIAMLRGIQGEGHPAIWYLLLRWAHDAVATPLVLPGAAFAVGFAAATLFVTKAPFRTWMLAMVLFGAFFLFEYTVSARNYGIAMLCLFGAAALPVKRGWAVGLCLAALCNTNVGAVIAAGAVLLFRAVELWTTRGIGRSAERRALLVASALTAAGVLLCFLTVYPPVNDAAAAEHPGGIGAVAVLTALVTPARALFSLAPTWLGEGPATAALLTVLLIAGPLSLLRTPGGFVAGVAGLAGFALFHGLLYPGSYRHHALYLALLIALHWMAANGGGGRWARDLPGGRAIVWGQWLAVALFALQLPASAGALLRAARGQPYSHSRDLATLLLRPELRDAVVIAEPDYLIEPLAYYGVRNPIWLIRERRFGTTVRYVRAVRRDLSLDDVLAEARMLRRATGRRVVIALEKPLDDTAVKTAKDGYVTTFTADPRQVRAFRAATRRIAAFTGSESGEDYEVFVLAR